MKLPLFFSQKKNAVKYHKKLLRNMKVFVDIDYRIGYNSHIRV